MKMLTEGDLIALLKEAYLRGFMATSEGSNAEYFGDSDTEEPIDCANWRYHRDQAVAELVRADAGGFDGSGTKL